MALFYCLDKIIKNSVASLYYSCIISLRNNKPCRDSKMAKLLVIKTAEAIIYVANGKVTLVKNALTGRFMKIAKFANIVNNLIVAAKKASSASSQIKTFCFNTELKLAMRKFKNLAKMAIALLGDVLVFTSRNYAHTGFDFTLLSMHS